MGCWFCSQLEGPQAAKQIVIAEEHPCPMGEGGVVQAPELSDLVPPPGPGAFLLFLTDASSFHKNQHSPCLQPLAVPRTCSSSCQNDPGHNAHFLPPAGLKQSKPRPACQDRSAGSNPPTGLSTAPGQL